MSLLKAWEEERERRRCWLVSRWIGHPFLWAIVSLPLSGLLITPHSVLQNMLYQLHFLEEETEAQRSCNFCVLPLGLWIAQCSVHYPVLPALYRNCGTSSHMQSSASRAPEPLLFLHRFRARVPPEVVRLLLWGQKEVGKAPLVKGSVASRFVCCVCTAPNLWPGSVEGLQVGSPWPPLLHCGVPCQQLPVSSISTFHTQSGVPDLNRCQYPLGRGP